MGSMGRVSLKYSWKSIQRCIYSSNVYFDFTIGELQGYDIDESVTWGQAIVGAELVDGATAQDAETEGVLEETDDGELEIID